MKFWVCDFDEYSGYLWLAKGEHEDELGVDVWECYDQDAGQWDGAAVRAKVLSAIKAKYGNIEFELDMSIA